MTTKCLEDLRAGFPPLFGGSVALERELELTATPAPGCAAGEGEGEGSCAAAVVDLAPPSSRVYKDVTVEEAWGLDKGERTVAACLSRHKRGFPLLIQGSMAERWAMNDLWNASYFFEAWDEGVMPSLRRIQGRTKARGVDFVLCQGNTPLSKHLAVRECNGDGLVPLPNVFGAPLEVDEMYWDDGVLKGGGVKGTSGELRVWQGPVAELGVTLRSHVGVHAGKIVDDIAVTNWADLLLFEYHKVHDLSKGMAQIQALRLNHNDDIEALFEKLHGKYGEDPLEMWEKQAAAPLLSKSGSAGDVVAAYGGMEATLMNAAGATLRSRQLRHHATLLQVSGQRTITLFRPQDSRAMYPYPSTHPAHPHSQVANLSNVYSKDHPLRKNFNSGVIPRMVRLEVGDVLHVPALWWIHERAVAESIGITIYTHDERR